MRRFFSLICCLFLFVRMPIISVASSLQTTEINQDENTINNNKRSKLRLRKNIVNGVNLLTQEMVNQDNMVYIIKYDYELEEDIELPENCVLKFKGGSLSSGKITGHYTRVENKRKVVFKDVTLEGDYSGEVRSSWFESDDDITFSNVVLFDKAIIDSDLLLDQLRTPTTHKSLVLQGIKQPTIYTNFEDDNTAGNGVNTLRITTPMGVKKVSLTIKDLNIVDKKYHSSIPLVKSMSSGVFVFPNDPNTNMAVCLENLNVKTRGSSFGFSHEREDNYKYDGTFYLLVNNCSIESGEFCVETYKPGDVKEMHFNNSHFVSTHSFRPELSLGTHAVAGQDRIAHIYVNNCTFDKGIENGIHEYAENPNTKFIVNIDKSIFNKYHYVSELYVHRAGEGVELVANNCVFKNEGNSVGGASGGEKLEFNDCTFELSYTGDVYGIFAAKQNIFRRCTFDCDKMLRFYGNYRNGEPLLYKSIIFDSCTFNNTTVVVSRFDESKAAGMDYQVKDCKFFGNSSIRHWDYTDFNKAKELFNTETYKVIKD